MDKKSVNKMTAAQKKAQARFKAAVSEAKKLRKKNPRLSQPEALKQAFAIEYKKERSGKRIAGPTKKSATKKASKKAAPKKAAKKTARKAAKPGERHTDTKSHNVNIRVISGAKKLDTKEINRNAMYEHFTQRIRNFAMHLNDIDKHLKRYSDIARKSQDAQERSYARRVLNNLHKDIKETQSKISQLRNKRTKYMLETK